MELGAWAHFPGILKLRHLLRQRGSQRAHEALQESQGRPPLPRPGLASLRAPAAGGAGVGSPLPLQAGTSLQLGVCGGDWPRPKAGRFPLARGQLGATPARRGGEARRSAPAARPASQPFAPRVRPEPHLRRERPQQRRQLQPEPERERWPPAGSPGRVLHSKVRARRRPGPSVPPGDSAGRPALRRPRAGLGRGWRATSSPLPPLLSHCDAHPPVSPQGELWACPGEGFASQALKDRCCAGLSSLALLSVPLRKATLRPASQAPASPSGLALSPSQGPLPKADELTQLPAR